MIHKIKIRNRVNMEGVAAVAAAVAARQFWPIHVEL